MKKIVLLLSTLFLLGLRPTARVTERPDFERFFKEKSLKGSFLLFDPQKNADQGGHFTAYNFERCRKGFIPASTYKILNTLIGLETGILKDEQTVMKWDGVQREIADWNRDQNLASAFRVSCVPCYQELARKIGVERMKKWVNNVGYGTMDITADNIDSFWLRGKSRITQEQQIDFLQRVHDGKVPFSPRNLAILKKVMLLDEKPTYKLYGKTGWAVLDDNNIGWFVGYVEKENRVYYFATNIENPSPTPATFVPGRRAITEAMLTEMGILD
ncbi:class D beta-lactamase [Tellurirhabdus bombi]|uniref:class D beta-lactamase n=1 Tax=Tellurirhabdus bombi TaxID=2907205 RepID=UPI001EFF559D|nr:class D beta-lactamase [Tellurirhabdus bombi]